MSFENAGNEFGDDAAYEIEIVFDWMVANEWELKQVLPDFKIFKAEHQHLFTPKINSLNPKTAAQLHLPLQEKTIQNKL